MGQRVFVNVVGFTDEERHALNLLFRMSAEHGTSFLPWDRNAPEPARLAIIDGQSYEGQVELDSPRNAALPVIWVGEGAPQRAAREFSRPIAWPEVVQAMDELFPAPMEFDIDLDSLETQPPLVVAPEAPHRRVLIAAADRDERLYLRARLALADLTIADEAEDAAQALELARANDYALALVDFSLPGGNGWQVVRELASGPRRVGKVMVTASRRTPIERLRAKLAGAAALFEKPPHPGRLHAALLQV